jgi:Ca2+-binding EF-hand superfamily protein
MIHSRKNGATACCVLLVLFGVSACSRRAEPVNSSRDASRLRPASGPLAPVSRNCMKSFQAFDSNGNGRVSRSEYFAFPHDEGNAAETFSGRDYSRDGVLTSDEFCARWRTAGGPHAASASGTGPLATPAVRNGGTCADHFAAFDSNANGQLSLAEFSAWPHIQGDPRLIFAARDRDRNGAVSQVEFCSAWSAPR